MGSFLDKPATAKETELKTNEENGLRAVCSAMQGWRVEMEDAHSVVPTLVDQHHPEYSWFAVFDGHGGSLVSRTAAQQLLQRVLRRPEWAEAHAGAPGTYDVDKIQEALRRGFLDMDEDLRGLAEVVRGDDHSGSTAVAALITPQHIFVANAGDSRCTLVRGGTTVAMSDDHKPFLEKEQRRIEAAGGTVTMRRVNGDLAVSRALGDFVYKHMRELKAEEQQVSAEPEIRIEPRTGDEQYLCLACDGIWDVMSNEDMTKWLLDHSAAMEGDTEFKTAAESLLDECLEKNSRDNMSVIFVDFVKQRRAARGAGAPVAAGAGGAGSASAGGAGAGAGASSDGDTVMAGTTSSAAAAGATGATAATGPVRD